MSNIYPPGAELAGRYRILGLTASVGIGSVFEAERLVGQGRVAFKWLRFANASRPFSLDELVQRAQAARGFSHPNAVETHDVVREGSSLFVVSQLVRGEPLLARLSPHLLRPAERVAVLLQAMRAVAAAHVTGLVHAGVHPGNVFLAQPQDGAPVVATVLDFVTSHFAALGLGTGNLPLARAVYRDREQLCGSCELDARADVFAFGVLTYQALTGRLPYYGENAIDLAGRLLTSVLTPVAALRPEASGALDRALSAALVVSRERRPPSLHELIEALASFVAYTGSSAAPARTEAGTALMVVQRSDAGVAKIRSLRTLGAATVTADVAATVTADVHAITAALPAPEPRVSAKSRAGAPARARLDRWLTGLALASSLAALAAVALYFGALSLGDAQGPPKARAAGTQAREQPELRVPARPPLPVSRPVERAIETQLAERAAERAAEHAAEQAPRARPVPEQVAAHVEELQSEPVSTSPSVQRTAKRRRQPRERLRDNNKARKAVPPSDSPFRAGLPPEVGEF